MLASQSKIIYGKSGLLSSHAQDPAIRIDLDIKMNLPQVARTNHMWIGMFIIIMSVEQDCRTDFTT